MFTTAQARADARANVPIVVALAAVGVGVGVAVWLALLPRELAAVSQLRLIWFYCTDAHARAIVDRSHQLPSLLVVVCAAAVLLPLVAAGALKIFKNLFKRG